MDDYPIPPEYCLIVRAFNHSRSLREAAQLLGCDPAALVRKTQKIANEFGLMQKIKGRWTLTPLGLRSTQWIEESIESQKCLLNEKPRFKITASMWLAEQVLIPNLKSLNESTENKFNWEIRSNQINGEEELLRGLTDYALVCQAPHDPAIAHRRVLSEKWIVVAPWSWLKPSSLLGPGELVDFLKLKTFVRHSSINPESALDFGLQERFDDLLFDNFICLRSAVESGLGWSCVPENLVRSSLRNRSVFKLNIPVKIDLELCIWWLRARKDSGKNIKVLANWLVGI